MKACLSKTDENELNLDTCTLPFKKKMSQSDLHLEISKERVEGLR